ncbi:hypothetical protein D9619_007092 [Psilocybe cf. subviscida]|uniref:Uncharacterized protein n=1 Tax=Psilocybe cf. subviscida TaxID=2480587 RepID=A0A8H5EWS7_9AGAR|nr:hypothetical protein D9619_007092 [Psilocybe cf. subviscida]
MIRRPLSSLARALSTSAARRQEVLPTTNSPIVAKLDFFNSVGGKDKPIPTYRLIDGNGRPLDGAELPDVRSSGIAKKTNPN